jgi:hypothetical protein
LNDPNTPDSIEIKHLGDNKKKEGWTTMGFLTKGALKQNIEEDFTDIKDIIQEKPEASLTGSSIGDNFPDMLLKLKQALFYNENPYY